MDVVLWPYWIFQGIILPTEVWNLTLQCKRCAFSQIFWISFCSLKHVSMNRFLALFSRTRPGGINLNNRGFQTSWVRSGTGWGSAGVVLWPMCRFCGILLSIEVGHCFLKCIPGHSETFCWPLFCDPLPFQGFPTHGR